MIVTLTPNPALDVTYRVAALAPGGSHRVVQPTQRAGGKGVNVASVLHAFGLDATVLAAVGGRHGDVFAADLKARGLPHVLVPSPVDTRRSLAVADPVHGATLFNEEGGPQPRAVFTALLQRLTGLVGQRQCSAVSVSGSFPPGAPAGWTATLVGLCRRAGVRVVLDLRGDQLVDALAAGPTWVKPNREEAEQTTGIGEPVAAARALVAAGAARAVVSDGERGLVAVAPGLPTLRARLPRRLEGNPTGAGDALAAALASAPSEPLDADAWRATVRRAVAWSAAAVLAPVAGEVVVEAAVALLNDVEIEEEP